MKTHTGRIAVVVATLLLGGCTLGPDYKRPELPVPTAFRGAAPGEAVVSVGDLSWWRVFEDETLQALIRIALRENYDLNIAAARVLEARAQVTIVRSAQFPDVNAGGSATYQRLEGQRTVFQVQDQFAPVAGFDFSFELDFWGRLRRSTEAARAELLASEDARRF